MINRAHAGTWQVRIIAGLTAFAGTISIISAATPAVRANTLAVIFPIIAQDGANLITLLFGFALVLLSYSLWNRKRSGWLLTVVLLTLISGLHLLGGFDFEAGTVTLILATWLFFLRPQFHARSDPPSVRRALQILVISLAFTLAYGTVGFRLLGQQFADTPTIYQAMLQTLELFFAPNAFQMVPVTRFGSYFTASIYLLALVTVSAALILLTRSVILRQPATADERERAEQIVTEHGRSSLARMTLLEDKAYFFSGGGSVVAFVVKNGFAVALGDPIGPADDFPDAVQGFRRHCQQNGWQCAYYQVLPDHLETYQAEGMKVLAIGQEAVIDLHAFTLSGNARKSLRQHFNRVTKRGYRAEVHQPPIDDTLYEKLHEISDQWLAETEGSEKRFSLGWFHEDYIRPVPIMCIYNPEGEVVAFANLLPEYQLNELTVDLMRYRADAGPGIMDFLFVSLFQWAKDAGYDSFNLGLVALAGVGQKREDPAVERALNYLFEHLNQFYNFKGLYDFKGKFQPEWSTRYLVYPGLVHLPGLAIALIRADSGDDAIWTYIRELELHRLIRDRLRRQKTTAKESHAE